MCYNVLKSLFVAMQLVLNCMVIVAFSIATFSNWTLNWPIKMYHYGSHSSTTSYDIITRE